MKTLQLPIVLLLLTTSVLGAEPALRYVRSGDDTVAVIVPQECGVVYAGQSFVSDANQPFAEHAASALAGLDERIRDVGGDPARVVKLNVAVATQEHADLARAAIRERYPAESRPPLSLVVGTLAVHRSVIGVDAVAVATTRPATRPLVYVSGQAEKGSSAADATAKTLASLIRTLESLGAAPTDVLEARCFLTTMSDADSVAAQFSKVFGTHRLALSCVEWKSSVPGEIELVAAAPPAPAGAPAIEYLTPAGMKASPLFARVVRINRGDVIYTAGLYAEKPGTGEEQVLSIFDQLQRVLKEAGGDMKHLVKATYYVSDDDASKQLNVLRPRFYDPQRPPAASKAMVPGVGLKDRSIAIDMIGVVVPPATTAPTP
jgi:enamine deaminase RidA (YjgF/YER057c/UK114 family)